jgi:hypothetical protein
LANLPTFRRMWDIPATKVGANQDDIPEELKENKLFQTMGDCQIVLRFFAFRNATQIRGSVRRMLNACMEQHDKDSKESLRKLERDFMSRLRLVHQLFGQDAFKLPETVGRRHSRPLFDAIMIAIDRLWDERKTLVRKRAVLRKRLDTILARAKTYDIVVGRPNTANAVRARINLVEKAFRASIP